MLQGFPTTTLPRKVNGVAEEGAEEEEECKAESSRHSVLPTR